MGCFGNWQRVIDAEKEQQVTLLTERMNKLINEGIKAENESNRQHRISIECLDKALELSIQIYEVKK